MSVTVTEKAKSRTMSFGSSLLRVQEVVINGAADETAAMSAFVAATSIVPDTITETLFNGSSVTFIRDSAEVEEILDARNDPTQMWSGVMRYVPLGISRQLYQTDDYSITFEIGKQSINIKTSKATLHKYAASGTPRDFKGIIGWDGENINGAEVDVPTFCWSETHYMPDSAVTEAYVDTLNTIANNPVLNASFRGFAAYGVRFEGLQGTRRHNGGDWEMNFKFSAGINYTDLYAGTGLATLFPGVVKNAWDYVWFTSQESTDATTNLPRVDVREVYVEQTYGNSDPTGLGLGTGNLYSG